MKKPYESREYDAPNRLAASIILADPRRHLRWPEVLSDEQVEASLMVRWARLVEAGSSEEQS